MKVNDKDINVNCTSLQGYINCTYDDLTATLGYPLEDGFDDYKSDAEWTIEFDDGTVATVYNYKNGKNYLGDEGTDVCYIEQWHIGGRDETAVQKVQDLINGVARKDYPQDQVITFKEQT
jgi:major membrane immunogen (membrane-anchored lipoprotein)